MALVLLMSRLNCITNIMKAVFAARIGHHHFMKVCGRKVRINVNRSVWPVQDAIPAWPSKARIPGVRM